MGVLMGIADLIPGISGGTIAYLLGFYDKLLSCLKSLSFANLKLWIKEKTLPKELKEAIYFLSWLFLGIAISFVVFSKVIAFILQTSLYRSYLYSLFFGIVVGSIQKMKKKVPFWGKRQFFYLVLGAVISFSISIAYLQNSLIFTLENTSFFSPYVFASGMLTIFAMLLPGISGSYILLLLGLYIPAIEALSLLIYLDLNAIQLLFQLAVGAIAGFLVFAHLVHYLNQRFKDRLQASLIGFLLGSLYFIWPFKTGAQEVDLFTNRQLVLCFLFFLMGVFFITRTSKKESKALPLVES